MAYDQADMEEYTFDSAAFGGGTIQRQIIGPKGKVGFVRDISVDITATMVGTTTVPEVQVGIAPADFTYGRYRLGNTAIAGYVVGMHRASQEPAIVGNPPRTAQDYLNHVQLDGYPLDANFRVPLGRIPASGLQVTNAVSGTAGVVRLFLNNGAALPQNVVVGQLVQVRGVQGATSAMTVGTLADGTSTISALNAAAGWIELTGTTFAGAYTQGGQVNFIVSVNLVAGTGGSPAGTGQVRVKIQWMGPETV